MVFRALRGPCHDTTFSNISLQGVCTTTLGNELEGFMDESKPISGGSRFGDRSPCWHVDVIQITAYVRKFVPISHPGLRIRYVRCCRNLGPSNFCQQVGSGLTSHREVQTKRLFHKSNTLVMIPGEGMDNARKRASEGQSKNTVVSVAGLTRSDDKGAARKEAIMSCDVSNKRAGLKFW